MIYQLPRDLVSDAWQMDHGNRNNSGNCCTFIMPIGHDKSMGNRGDPVKTQAGIGAQQTTSGRLFQNQQGCGVPGLFQNS